MQVTIGTIVGAAAIFVLGRAFRFIGQGPAYRSSQAGLHSAGHLPLSASASGAGGSVFQSRIAHYMLLKSIVACDQHCPEFCCISPKRSSTLACRKSSRRMLYYGRNSPISGRAT